MVKAFTKLCFAIKTYIFTFKNYFFKPLAFTSETFFTLIYVKLNSYYKTLKKTQKVQLLVAPFRFFNLVLYVRVVFSFHHILLGLFL